MDTLWVTMAPKVLEIFREAAQRKSPGWVAEVGRRERWKKEGSDWKRSGGE